MRFTLVYKGDLPPKGRSEHKWRIRKEIEPQLRQLWTVPPFDSIQKYKDPDYKPDDCYVGKAVGDVTFIPCISDILKMRAELHIRLLSATMPGGLVHCGDIDNRLKTLLDALCIPSQQQIPTCAQSQSGGHIFCLLADDKLVTRVDVSNDRLLTVPEHSTETLVLIDVHPVASTVTMANIGISV